MTAVHEARLHVRKAEEFLEAAEISLDRGLFNAATSDAVVAGINSKDAICLKLTGRTKKSGTPVTLSTGREGCTRARPQS